MDSTVQQKGSYFLQPGYIYFPEEASVVRTVIGHCVAVCLWDKKNAQGAMNHFLHPTVRDPDRATPKFGNVATAEMVAMMERAGSRREDISAQILGGAKKYDDNDPSKEDDPESDIGQQNVAIAREVLTRKGIQIVSEDTGGSMGRKVIFDTSTGHVMVLKVQNIREGDWDCDDPEEE